MDLFFLSHLTFFSPFSFFQHNGQTVFFSFHWCNHWYFISYFYDINYFKYNIVGVRYSFVDYKKILKVRKAYTVTIILEDGCNKSTHYSHEIYFLM